MKLAGLIALLNMLAIALVPSVAIGATPDGAASLMRHKLSHAVPQAENQRLYIVQLRGDPVTRHPTTRRALAFKPRARRPRYAQLNSAASRRYAAQLKTAQRKVLAHVAARPVYRYRYVYNGFALRLTPAGAARLRARPQVKRVMPDTLRHLASVPLDRALIGAPAIWNGDAGIATKGAGIVVAIIDSGINFRHPAFAAPGPVDGYQYINPLGNGVYLGACDPNNTQQYDADFACNAKLIGAYNELPNQEDNARSPGDSAGHGSAVASVAAGNQVRARIAPAGKDDITDRPILYGVAPHASIIAYDACFDSGNCSTAAVAAAVEQAVRDAARIGEPMVINFSIGGGSDPYEDADEQAFLNAAAAGLFVAAAAGNNGRDGPRTVRHLGPWVTTVGASTGDVVFDYTTRVSFKGGDSPPADADGSSNSDAYGPARIVYAGDAPYGDALCAQDAPVGTWDGAIVVCDRGSLPLVEKVDHVKAGGAAGALIVNVSPDLTKLYDFTFDLPAAQLDRDAGEAVKDWIARGGKPKATIHASRVTVSRDATQADRVAAFSARGPSPKPYTDLLKPDLVAPGVNVAAAYKASDSEVDQYRLLQGTSLATPQVTGAAALLLAMHPDYSPLEVKSALMSTATTDALTATGGEAPATPLARGAGRLDVAAAARAGFVLDETRAAFKKGDLKPLNLASLADHHCRNQCTWTRTLTSVLPSAADYSVSVNSPDDLDVTIKPSNFTLAAGGTQKLEISADVGGQPYDQWLFAALHFDTDATSPAGDGTVASQHLTLAIKHRAKPPAIGVKPKSFTVTLAKHAQAERQFVIRNKGIEPLDWHFVDRRNTGFAGANDVREQPANNETGYPSTYFGGDDHGVYAADDFTVDGELRISKIRAAGFNNKGELADAEALNWYIYSDDGGQPAGNPEGDEAAVWHHSAAPFDPGVDVSNNNIRLDLIAATGHPVTLAAGTYWLVVYPKYSGDFGGSATPTWYWFGARAAPGGAARLIDPADLTRSNLTHWTELTTDDGSPKGLAFSLTGIESCAALPRTAPNWFHATPEKGTIEGGQSEIVTIRFRSGGVAAGGHDANACIKNNDPENDGVRMKLALKVKGGSGGGAWGPWGLLPLLSVWLFGRVRKESSTSR